MFERLDSHSINRIKDILIQTDSTTTPHHKINDSIIVHRKFTKAQCHACRQYGHIVTHCQLLPRVLAIINFAKKHGDKCEYVLKQYTQNNSVDSKKMFVRVLQEINVLPQENDSDHYMEDDIIINTVMDNIFTPNEATSNNE